MSLKKSIRTKILKAAAVGAVTMLEKKLAKKGRGVSRAAARPVKRAAARVGDEFAARREARAARATAGEVVKMAKRIAKEQLQGGKAKRRKKGLVAAAAGAVATAALRQGGRIALAKLTRAAAHRLDGSAARPKTRGVKTSAAKPARAGSAAARTSRPRPGRGGLPEPLGI